jgi:hypothetical protein
MAALENEELEIDLANPIHLLYKQSQWETKDKIPRHKGPIPIRGDEEGYWLVSLPFPLKLNGELIRACVGGQKIP